MSRTISLSHPGRYDRQPKSYGVSQVLFTRSYNVYQVVVGGIKYKFSERSFYWSSPSGANYREDDTLWETLRAARCDRTLFSSDRTGSSDHEAGLAFLRQSKLAAANAFLARIGATA